MDAWHTGSSFGILFALLFQLPGIKTQYGVLDHEKYGDENIPIPDPSISEILTQESQSCDANSYDDIYDVQQWWSDHFFVAGSAPTPAMLPLQNFLDTNRLRAKFEDICFFRAENYGYLYECDSRRMKCQCMTSPTVTVAVRRYDTTSISCLVAKGRTCVAERRQFQTPYLCEPGYYCETNVTKKCQPCNNMNFTFCPNVTKGTGSRITPVFFGRAHFWYYVGISYLLVRIRHFFIL